MITNMLSSSHIDLSNLSTRVRALILQATTAAGSGHPTSSLSAADLMTVCMFGGFFCFDVDDPKNSHNDRLIFSKGHAAPLLYALWVVAGAITEEEFMTLRKFGSRLEGHPTSLFPYTEAATGSLGQGLSIGIGFALNARRDSLSYTTYVLLGDSEMAEGSVWEAANSAAYYKLDNLVAVVDVNRLGQRGETMFGHKTEEYKKRLEAFGWNTKVIDGHDIADIESAFSAAEKNKGTGKPFAIIAKTLKGKGVSIFEDKDGWHGKALSAEELSHAMQELGSVDETLRGALSMPQKAQTKNSQPKAGQPLIEKIKINYPKNALVATRKAYGNALVRLAPAFPELVVLDAEVSNSTFAETFQKAYPERFFEMFIAEQNMVGVACGMALRGKRPCISTFAAFLTRAYDQIRMANYSHASMVVVGSHAGVSIGEDGVSQMGLEDIALFRSLLHSTVLYPSDAVQTEKLVEAALNQHGIVYIRTTRKDTPIMYQDSDEFPIGKAKVIVSHPDDIATIIAAGITVHEALSAAKELEKEGIRVRVIDVYSVKPIDEETIRASAQETKNIITVEDHYAEGGIGEAVAGVVSGMPVKLIRCSVQKEPRSGKPNELLDYEGISKNAIQQAVKNIGSM